MQRPVTPEDREAIDTINRHIYAAWKLWREYFNRTPEQAAELMVNAIKSHARKDVETESGIEHTEENDLTKH